MTIHLPGNIEQRTFAGVIFDMDGTLIDSTPAVIRSWLTWAEEYDVPPEKLQGFHGVPAQGIIDAVLPKEQHAGALARIIEIEVADTEGIVVLPGVRRALADLAGAKAAIATSCTRDLAQARLAASGLSAPDVVVTFDDVTRGKPAPDPFLVAAERLGVDPTQCLIVEDAPSGLAAGRAAGGYTLAVVTSTELAHLQADTIVSDLSQVRFLVGPDGIRVEFNPAAT